MATDRQHSLDACEHRYVNLSAHIVGGKTKEAALICSTCGDDVTEWFKERERAKNA